LPVEPGTIVCGAVIVVDGTGLAVTLTAGDVPVQPVASVTVTVYDPVAPAAGPPVSIGGFATPKPPSGINPGINRDAGWKAWEPTGGRPVTQFAIDDTWRALRFRPLDEVGK